MRALTVAAWLLASAGAAAQSDSALLEQLGVPESAQSLRKSEQWRVPQKIVVAVDSDARLAWLREVTSGTSVELIPARNVRELHERIAEADAMIGPCIADVIGAGHRLRWVQTSGVGVEDCLSIPAIREGKVLLTNMQRITASTVAEHALALVLALTRRLSTFTVNQHEAKWDPTVRSSLSTLEGKTLLIVGLGNVGKQIARRASAFDMRIIAIREGTGGPIDGVEYIGQPAELHTLVSRADVVINATPLTPQTEGMFDAKVFARMRKGAVFVNVGRGRSVVTTDLVQALESGVLSGAGLDVVEPEPLPHDHPFWRMPNVLITPHIADESELKRERSWLLARENLRRYVNGDKLLAVIDVQRGY